MKALKKAYKWIKKKGSMLYVPEWMTKQDGYIYIPHRRKAFRASGSWADWDEQSEDSLSLDQDRDNTEDTYIAFEENTVAGGNETGRGAGLSGSDLVLTQYGNIAGAEGSPPYRQFDGTDDYQGYTVGLINATLAKNGTVWSWFIKLEDFNHSSYLETPFCCYRSDALPKIMCSISEGAATLRMFADDKNGNRIFTFTSTDNVPTTGVVHIGMWCDGTKVRGGFTVGGIKPAKWSDFDTGKRGESTSVCDLGTGWSGLDTVQSRIGNHAGYTYKYVDAKFYYIVLSSVCLIDNSA